MSYDMVFTALRILLPLSLAGMRSHVFNLTTQRIHP